MPKTNKRAESKYTAKITRAHSTQLPNTEDNNKNRLPGVKPPARGVARYPWAASILVLLILVCTVALLFTNHLGPFAPPKAKSAPKPTATTAVNSQPGTASATANSSTGATDTSNSPCLDKGVLGAITNAAAPLTAAQISKINHTYTAAKNVTDPNKIYCAGINTNKGLIVVELDPKIAPQTVNNFVFLAQNHFYDGLTFHRVIANLIDQGGDPQGTGSGGPGYSFKDEPVQGEYTAGTIAMANSGPNTNGSQFFINLADNSSTFQKSYNLFGHVVQGLDVAKKMTATDDGTGNPVAGATPDVMQYVVVTAAS